MQDQCVEIMSGQLDPHEMRGKAMIVRSLTLYWDAAKFCKGFSQPVEAYVRALPFVESAADLTVRIRRWVQKVAEGQGLMDQPVAGKALEYLHTLDHSPLRDDPTGASFVRDLVLHMCQTDNGFVGGLSRDDLLAVISRCYKSVSDAESPISLVRRAYQQTGELLQLLEKTSNDALLDSVLFQLTAVNRDIENAFASTMIQEVSSPLPEVESTIVQSEIEPSENERSELKNEAKEPIERNEPNEPNEPEASGTSDEQKIEEQKNEQMDVEESVQKEPEASESDIQTEESQQNKQWEQQIEKVAFGVLKVENDVRVIGEKVRSLTGESLLVDPIRSEKDLEKLQKRAVADSEHLVQNLLALDTIVGASEDIRPRRKEQVLKIQTMLREIDEINGRLRELIGEVHEKNVQQRPPTPESEGESDEEERRCRSEITSSESPFRKLKLKPSFDVEEFRDRYTISAYIPGIAEGELRIGFDAPDSDVLSITGVREPTPDAISDLRKRIRAQHRNLSPADEEALLLQSASGRYGSFEERFQLPSRREIDRNRVSASYNKGQVVVHVPKRVAPPVRSNRNPFYSDRDIFW